MLNKAGSWIVLLMTTVGVLLGCENLEQPSSATAPQLLVQGVVDAQAGQQLVIIGHTHGGSEQKSSVGIGTNDPVNDAVVTLTLPTGQTLVAARLDSAGVYGVDSGAPGFDPGTGGTYLLHVRTSSGAEVSGSTTMPAVSLPFTGVVSGLFFRRLQDTLRLSWPRVPGAKSYEVLIRSSGTPNYRIFTDTSLKLPGTTLTLEGDMVFAPGADVQVIVSAVDANYYDYYRAQADPFAGAPPSHLTGAVGVFGSIAPMFESTFSVR